MNPYLAAQVALSGVKIVKNIKLAHSQIKTLRAERAYWEDASKALREETEQVMLRVSCERLA